MNEQKDLLVEIGTEELPPKALVNLIAAFTKGIDQQLSKLGLKRASIQSYATPRRLAVQVKQLDSAQQDKQVERKGPAVKAAYDAEGNPTKAALGFARSCSVEVENLETQDTPKGSWLVHKQLEKGRSTFELMPDIVEKSLAGLPIPKRMRWGSRNEEFVRPVHWVMLLFGDEVVPGNIMGQDAGRETRGHRFHHPSTIVINHPNDYASTLKDKGYVIADFNERRQLIDNLVRQEAEKLNAKAVIDQELLNEVTALNEWPVAVIGSFDESFLDVPSECLIQAMQGHQKYFPVVNEQGDLLPRFITISNIQSKDIDQVRAGNERVIRPRFSDAAFFWQQDLKQPLEHHIESLKTLKFQDKLGSMHDKAGRIASLADSIADQTGFDKNLAMRAAWLCKCDLMTEMVGEFASLQGIMGRYYAMHSGEDPQVIQAMEEVYMPRHAGDQLPQSECGRTIAIADRLDTLVGIFAIGLRPTGAKDPYGLRRAALGVLRIMIETPLDIDLGMLLEHAADSLKGEINADDQCIGDVFDYMMERLKAYYTDQSIPADSVDAVIARKPTRPADFNQRVLAVTEFRKLPEAESLSAANKRIRNILRKTDEVIPDQFKQDLLEEDAEKALATSLLELGPKVNPLFESGQYTQGMQLLAGLRVTVDDFFDQVMVMVEDTSLRQNRLALLTHLENLFLSVADFSRLQ
ncbi:MAG: glycine--tRNA ligase subunit beta [Pseudomonadota bacterium]